MSVNQMRTNQGGSVASFIIGGVVLAAILIGGIYLLQKRDQSAVNLPVASNRSSANPSTPGASPSTSPKASSSVQPSQPPTATVPNGSTPLPATGPDDYMPTGVVLAILTGVGISYVRSRQSHAKALQQVDESVY